MFISISNVNKNKSQDKKSINQVSNFVLKSIFEKNLKNYG
jgi:hypothetical protein